MKRLIFVCFTLLFLIILSTDSAFAVQELKVGFIEGRGDDAAVQVQALKNAEIEYEVIGKDDYKLEKLLNFDVIGVGVVAYDKNEDLKANFKVVNEYVEKGGYLVTLDFQQDTSWEKGFLPHPLTLFDDDLEEGVGVEIIDAPIWHEPNEITEDHFVGWGQGDFMADAPHEVKGAWQPLLLDKANSWPLIAGSEAGRGYVVLNSLQVLQALGRTGNEKIAEVLQNFLFWRGPLAVVHTRNKMTTTWARLKETSF